MGANFSETFTWLRNFRLWEKENMTNAPKGMTYAPKGHDRKEAMLAMIEQPGLEMIYYVGDVEPENELRYRFFYPGFERYVNASGWSKANADIHAPGSDPLFNSDDYFFFVYHEYRSWRRSRELKEQNLEEVLMKPTKSFDPFEGLEEVKKPSNAELGQYAQANYAKAAPSLIGACTANSLGFQEAVKRSVDYAMDLQKHERDSIEKARKIAKLTHVEAYTKMLTLDQYIDRFASEDKGSDWRHAQQWIEDCVQREIRKALGKF